VIEVPLTARPSDRVGSGPLDNDLVLRRHNSITTCAFELWHI
jgi:hypothetical protein